MTSDAIYVREPLVPNEKQAEFYAAVRDPAAAEILFSGSIRAGKSQACGTVVTAWAWKHRGIYLVARATYPELRDSTLKVFLEGDGGLEPVVPHELRESFNKNEMTLRLKNGSEIIFRAIQEHGLGKIRNITLAGVFIDQLEELDDGRDGEAMYDELLGRLSDPRGPRKLIAAANPGPTTHWVYRRLVNPETREPQTRIVHVALKDNAHHLPAEYVARMEATKKTRPHWYRSRVLGEWGSFEGAAFVEFAPSVHVVEPFLIPNEWRRFESLDHGINHDTAVYPWAVDFDGNAVVFGEYSSPGLVSAHAEAILRRRASRKRGELPIDGLNWWQATDEDGWPLRHPCWADPSVRNRTGGVSRLGDPASVLTEYRDKGVALSLGNNDPRAGYARLLEMLHVEPGRIPPYWSQVPAELGGAPRLYVFATCPRLIEQLRSAPVKKDGAGAAEMVDPVWEADHGHSTASIRYGAMTWARPSPAPDDEEPTDPRAARLWRHRRELLKRVKADARRNSAQLW